MPNNQNDLEIGVNQASFLAQLKEMEKAIEKLGKGGVHSVDDINKAWDRFGKGVSSITDKAEASQRRMAQAYVRTAQAASMTNEEKILARGDRLVKQLGTQTAMIDKVREATQKLLAVEKARAGNKGKGYEDSPEQTAEFLGRSLRDIYVGRPALATVALGRAVNNLTGLPFILGGITVGIAALGAASLSSAVSLGQLAEATENVKLRTGFTTKEVAQFGFAARAVGQDIDVFERGMRGLTTAVEDQSSAGDKARGWLVKFGVDLRSVREGTSSPAEVFKQIAAGLDRLPVGFERTSAQMDIFKRIGIELIPVMEGLNKNTKLAADMDWGFDDAAQKRLLNVDAQFDEFKEAWKDFKEKIIQDTLAVPVIFILKSIVKGPGESTGVNQGASLMMDVVRDAMGFPTEFQEQTISGNQIMGVGRSPRYPSPGSAQLEIDRLRGNSAVAGYFASQGTAGQLKLAELELSKLGRVQASVSSPEDVSKIRAQEKVVESLKEQLRLEERSKSINEDIAKLKLSVAETLSMEYMTPIEKQIRDKIAGGASSSQAAQYRGIGAPLAYRQRTDYQNTSLRSYIAAIERGDTREMDEGASMAAHQAMVARTLAERTAAASRAMSRSVQGVSEAGSLSRQGSAESLLNLYGIVSPDTAQTRQTMAGVRAGIDTRRQVEEFEAKKVRALEDYDDKRDVIESQAYEDETKRADNLHSLKLSHENELSALKTGHETDLAAIQSRHLEANAQEYRRQLDSIKQEVSSLLTTGLTRPSQFLGQLGSTVRDSAVKAVVNPLSEMTARYLQPLIFGGAGGGGMSDIRLVNGAMPVVIMGGGGGVGGGGGLLSNLPLAWGTPGGFGLGGGGFSFPGAPGGTSGFSGPYSMGGGGGYGSGSGGGNGGFPGLASFLNPGAFFNSGSIALGGGRATTAAGIGGIGGKLAGGLTSSMAASLYTAAGVPLAMAGLMGNRRGTWSGIGMGTLGGALTGAGIGTMIAPGIGTLVGAGIGAAVGFGIGVGEKIAGVRSPRFEAIEGVKRTYGITISNSMADQIVSLAKSKYGGDVSIATRDPEVRNMLMLYASGTGQSAAGAMSSMTPRGAGLVQSGGSLSQQSSYVFGQQYSYQSSLPIYGGGGGGTYPSMGGGPSIALSISGRDAASFFTGQVVTPDYVQGSMSSALRASNGRVDNALAYAEPGAIRS